MFFFFDLNIKKCFCYKNIYYLKRDEEYFLVNKIFKSYYLDFIF